MPPPTRPSVILDNPPQPPPQSPHEPPRLPSTQSSTPPIKRRRRLPTPPPQPPQPPDDDNNCTICLEPWTASGPHQLCCMPCGHLFGCRCITDWLKSQPRRTRVCPTCKTPARVRDLRYLFGVPSTLRTLDTAESDRLRKQLSQERDAHRDTRARLDEARRLARTYRDALADAQRARVPCMTPPPAHLDRVALIGERRTNGGSITVACDGATVLYTENAPGSRSEQRLCRTELNRLNHSSATPPFSKRVNAIAVSANRELPRYIAVATADRHVTVLTPSLQHAAEVTVAAVPTSVSWMSTPHHLAVGLLNGEVAIFDIRNPAAAPVFRPLVAERGWRAVHSLGEIVTAQGGRLIAGAPCGVVTISPHSGFVEDVPVGEGPVAGVSVHDGLLMVATKHDKPCVSIYEGLTVSEGSVKPGPRVGGVLTGYNHDTPFIQPAILPGLGGTKGSIVVCPDTAAEHGVAAWGFRRDGVEGERWVRQSAGDRGSVGVRAVACASIPPTAKIVGLPERVRGVFAAVGDDCVRVFSAGRYR